MSDVESKPESVIRDVAEVIADEQKNRIVSKSSKSEQLDTPPTSDDDDDEAADRVFDAESSAKSGENLTEDDDNLHATKHVVTVDVAHANTTQAHAHAATPLPGTPHRLATASFGTVTRCQVCLDVIWGLARQGLECASCKVVLHHRCREHLSTLLPICPQGLDRVDRPPIARHVLLEESTLADVFCNGCGGSVGGIGVHRCQVCRATCHDQVACKDALRRTPCRAWATADEEGEDSGAKHHFTSGSWTGTCAACNTRATGIGVHFVEHCVACGVMVHKRCKAGWTASACTLGPLGSVVLAPNTVRLLATPDSHGRRFVASKGALLTFINRRSGGGAGALLYASLLRAGLSPLQLYDLGRGGPAEGLRHLAHVAGTRILVCGGDGTAGWLLNELDQLWPHEELKHPGAKVVSAHDSDDEGTDGNTSSSSNGGSGGGKGGGGGVASAVAAMASAVSVADDDPDQPSQSKKKKRVRKRKHAMPVARPSVGVLPIGTGNDLARVTGWGGGYDGEPVIPWLQALGAANVRLMDRWSVSIASAAHDADVVAGEPLKFAGLERKYTMNNYFSVGVDAEIALRFHRRREANPALFTGRTVNKAWYGLIGAREVIKSSPAGTKMLKKLIRVIADDKEIDLGDNQAIVVLNLQSYSGGVDLWNDETNSAMDDGKLELVGFSGPAHAGFVRSKVASVNKLCQASHVRIEWITPHSIACQVDGEPWSQKPAAIELRFWNQSPMLVRRGFGARFFTKQPIS